MTLQCLNGIDCFYINCKLKKSHWHCSYCKSIETGFWSRRIKNCTFCASEITAKAKLSRVRRAIKKKISECEDKDKDKIIIFLKSNIHNIINDSKHFHGTYDDVSQIIDNYYDKTKPLPIISVNGCIGKVDLNISMKNEEFDNTALYYLDMIKEQNRENLYFKCPYQDKDECKYLGGKWDKEKKSWYIPKEIDSKLFDKWLSSENDLRVLRKDEKYYEKKYIECFEKYFISIICKDCVNESGHTHVNEDDTCEKCNIALKYNTCISCYNDKQFQNNWKVMKPIDKLSLYGEIKLKILAKNKKLKGYTKYGKDELINILKPLVNDDDFPIKE